MRITVFGGSEPRRGEPAYEEALRLGRLIGQRGYTVLTGGYIGTMEAVSRGVMETGGHVIGVTCDEIEAWRPIRPNAWVQEELRFPSLRLRLNALIDQCDAAIALPGGIGTLAEVAMMWSNLQTEVITLRPLILVGPGWKSVILAVLPQLPPGKTELMCHPGHPPSSTRTSFGPEREVELLALTDPLAFGILRAAGVHLVRHGAR